jgi:thiol-disulfide isomerase/thioredoxin
MKKLIFLFALLATIISIQVSAEETELHPFSKGSYQQLLQQHEGRPLMLVIWSYTCSSCLKEMSQLHNLIDKYPQIDVVLLSVDDFSATQAIQKALQENRLNAQENWLFIKDNSAKLRFEIDPTWYGELPRTYFFDKTHKRVGFSGVLDEQRYRETIESII